MSELWIWQSLNETVPDDRNNHSRLVGLPLVQWVAQNDIHTTELVYTVLIFHFLFSIRLK